MKINAYFWMYTGHYLCKSQHNVSSAVKRWIPLLTLSFSHLKLYLWRHHCEKTSTWFYLHIQPAVGSHRLSHLKKYLQFEGGDRQDQTKQRTWAFRTCWSHCLQVPTRSFFLCENTVSFQSHSITYSPVSDALHTLRVARCSLEAGGTVQEYVNSYKDSIWGEKAYSTLQSWDS